MSAWATEKLRRIAALYFSGGAPNEWHYFTTRPFRPVRSTSGEQLRGLVMRRRVDGEWQYRALSEEECREREDLDAI